MSKRPDGSYWVPALLLVAAVVTVVVTILGWDGTARLLELMF